MDNDRNNLSIIGKKYYDLLCKNYNEKTAEKLVKEYLIANRAYPIKLLPGIINGLPDQIVLFPGGKTGFIEFKSKGKKLSKLQTIALCRLELAGFQCFIIDSPEAFIPLDEYVQHLTT